MARDRPLVTLSMSEPPYVQSRLEISDEEDDDPPKRWYHSVPLILLIVLMLAPHPSWLIVLVKFHLQTLHAHATFLIHLLVSYALSFLAFCSLIVCLCRDPGPVSTPEDIDEHIHAETSLTEALLEPADDFNSPAKWCKKCWAPKPERTHHCSVCRRCVLKMDHHCPWLANSCIGHRTYPAFVHFLTCITLLAIYIGTVSSFAVYYAFTNPFKIDDTTPLHEMLLTFSGIVITLVVGSFLAYHLYLITRNETTLESLSPFLLLRELANLPGAIEADTFEHRLSPVQRRIVKRAHGYIRLYDVGWKKNWAQVFGWEKKYGWIYRLLIGGASKGDGRIFQRNPRADDLLRRLAAELANADKAA